MPQPMYVPILKGKEGEFAALEQLSPDIVELTAPLIEVPSIPFDYVNERPSRTLDEHIAGIAQRLERCWGGRLLYLDLPWFGEEEFLADGTVALRQVLEGCTNKQLNVVPVISPNSSSPYLVAAGEYATRCRTGLCLRLSTDYFAEDIDQEAVLTRILLATGGIEPADIDLLVDVKDLRGDDRDLLIVRYVFSMIPRSADWRRVVFAATSFPEDLSDVDASTAKTLPRLEWQMWETLQKRPNQLPRRDLIFGDYGIAHPQPRELDPRMMRMSASIRYTTSSDWLIVKGRNVRQYGFEQFFELCRALVQRKEFSGRDFSWGDSFIADCAERRLGPGNATTWRKVGTNHHLTLVAQQLASRHVV